MCTDFTTHGFPTLFFQPEHRPTCMAAISLGYPLTPEFINIVIKKDPVSLDQILDMDFVIESHWDYYNDELVDRRREIFSLCRNHYGADLWLKIVLSRQHLCGYFIELFKRVNSKILEDFLFEQLRAQSYVSIMLVLKSHAARKIIRNKIDPTLKLCLFTALSSNYLLLGSITSLSEAFGFEYCLSHGFISETLIEEEFWEYDNTKNFWAIMHKYPEAMAVAREIKDDTLLESMEIHRQD